MRSFLATLVLASLAFVLGTLSVVQLRNEDLTSIFGAPPRAVGEKLFSYDLNSPVRLTVTTGDGGNAVFKKGEGIWYMEAPHQDRADFRHLQSLVFAARHLTIEEVFDKDELDPSQTGLDSSAYEIRITDKSGLIVAHYELGLQSPWHRVAGQNGELAETFYIRPRGDFDDGRIYLCAGANARILLDAGLDIFRDHRPFLFDAGSLADIRIRSSEGELLVARESLRDPWKVTKPLSLRTDPEAVALLVRGLYELEAPKLHEPGEVTLPPRTDNEPFLEISLGFFDPKGGVLPQKISLEVEPPANDTALHAYASVTGRSTLFELPLRPSNGHLSLSELPISINDLRSRTLLSRNPTTLRQATIVTPTAPAPLVLTLGKDAYTNDPRWIIRRGDASEPANESTVFRLFSALTREKVTGFASDAPGDLAPFGLDTPAKTLVLEHGEGEEARRIEFAFGRADDGKFYALRKDESSVMEIDAGIFDQIETEPSAWRDSLLWSMSAINLQGFSIERPNQPPLFLTYNFLTEQWSARQAGKDISVRLNKQRANILLENLENLRVSRWLGPDHEEAANRLFDPALTIEIAYRVQDEDGNDVGVHRRLLNLTPASYAVGNQLYYGRLSGDPDYFIISRNTFDQLNVPLLEE